MYAYAFYILFAHAFATICRETIRTSGIIVLPPTSALKPTMESAARFLSSISLKSYAASQILCCSVVKTTAAGPMSKHDSCNMSKTTLAAFEEFRCVLCRRDIATGEFSDITSTPAASGSCLVSQCRPVPQSTHRFAPYNCGIGPDRPHLPLRLDSNPPQEAQCPCAGSE